MSRFYLRQLTPRQREIFDFIDAYICEHSYPPVLREVGRHFGFSEKAANDHVNSLVKKGYVEYEDGKPRTIRLTQFSRYFSIPSPSTLNHFGIEKDDLLMVSPDVLPLVSDCVLTTEGHVEAFREGMAVVGKVVSLTRQFTPEVGKEA